MSVIFVAMLHTVLLSFVLFFICVYLNYYCLIIFQLGSLLYRHNFARVSATFTDNALLVVSCSVTSNS